MKKILIFMLFSISVFGSNMDEFASHMGYQRDYNTALSLAKSQNKPLMLVVSTDYCPWCRKFERKTLKYSGVAIKVNKEFVSVVIDKRRDKGTYPSKYASPITPAVFFINPHNGSTIAKSVGYIRKKDYIEKLESVMFLFSSEDK